MFQEEGSLTLPNHCDLLMNIPLELQSLYNYDFNQDENKLTIRFDAPSENTWENHKFDFNSESLNISLRISSFIR